MAEPKKPYGSIESKKPNGGAEKPPVKTNNSVSRGYASGTSIPGSTTDRFPLVWMVKMDCGWDLSLLSETTTAQPAMFTIERGKNSGAIEAPKRSGALEPTKRSGALEPLKRSGALEPPKKSGYGDGKKVDEGIERPPEKT
ncbi:hypothetical protein QC763_607660 [Podospora pseudopauciseta]|uniref:Uncharacterized protein n=1 Tax=Podospora pseudopauciseta TaxID=2093780 RepID=A0ABR0H5T3_9PEZI|nr:hypothetical protein QC763_607660 [Podospora pseudopauciseta]